MNIISRLLKKRWFQLPFVAVLCYLVLLLIGEWWFEPIKVDFATASTDQIQNAMRAALPAGSSRYKVKRWLFLHGSRIECSEDEYAWVYIPKPNNTQTEVEMTFRKSGDLSGINAYESRIDSCPPRGFREGIE